MLNQCNFTGRCGKDPELRYTQGGTAVANLSIACSEKWGKGDNQQERTEWINLVFWNKLAEVVSEYVCKGDLILVSGKMRTEEWEDNQGGKRYSVKIHVTYFEMLGGRGDGRGSGQAPDDVPF